MHQKMSIRIKNWPLSLLALLVFCFFISLGLWQLSRAQQKQLLLNTLEARLQAQPIDWDQLNQLQDARFYPIQLTGYFDNQHTFLLDNKTWHGQVGYEIYTPFKTHHAVILVDRGFIPIGATRKILPAIRASNGKVNITGTLNKPPTYVAWGPLYDQSHISWPLRIEFVDLNEIAKLLKSAIFTDQI